MGPRVDGIFGVRQIIATDRTVKRGGGMGDDVVDTQDRSWGKVIDSMREGSPSYLGRLLHSCRNRADRERARSAIADMRCQVEWFANEATL
jgi:hypothetical protein